MSDNLLKRADEWSIVGRDLIHSDTCYLIHTPCLIRALAARVLELEAELAAFARGVRVRIPTETMEAEFSAHHRRGYKAGEAAMRERAERAEAVAAALRSLVAEGTLEYTGRIEAERDALRALLREAQKWLGDNDDEDSLLRRIDAALGESHE